MEKKLSYSDQLKHPDWQRKRLKILERDDFACQCCGITDKTLHVHHFYYTKGCKVHEYPDEALITLCEGCHKEQHNTQIEVIKEISEHNLWEFLASYNWVKTMQELQAEDERSVVEYLKTYK